MSKSYDRYLSNHIHAVMKCYELLTGDGLKSHDDSKFELRQYVAYDQHFYPEEQEIELDPLTTQREYDYAWNEHQKKEKHHWQYWVLIKDSGGFKPLEIPERYVFEMVADWGAFAFLKHDGNEIIKWYADNKENMILHVETRILVDKLVPKMAEAINKFWREI